MLKAHLLPAILLIFFLSPTPGLSQCPGTCIPLLYEGFDYPTDEPLNARVGGTGWEGGWDVQGQNTDVPGYQSTASNLSYLDLQAFGNSVKGGRVYLTSGRYLDTDPTGPFSNYLTNGLIGAPGTTLYFSAMLRKEENNDQQVFTGLHWGNIPWNFESPRIGMGYFGSNSNSGGQQFWTLRIEDNYYLSTDTVAVDSTALLILRIDFGADDNHTVHLFTDPVTIGAIEPTAEIVQNVTTPLGFRAIAYYGGNNESQSTIDELRISETYQCAVPDAGTSLNQLPVSSFTTSAISGQVPFTVNFDGSASMDPDGNISSYEWSFGDGGIDSIVAPSYTFEHVGYLQTVLTVTDTCGSQSSQFIYIQARDSNNEFPCNSSVSLTNPASPGMNNGAISGNSALGNTYRLFNETGFDLTQSNGNFSNLTAGTYSLEITGSSGCSEIFPVNIFIDSTLLPTWQPESCSFQMGVNVDGVPYWNQVRPFKDFKLSGREFFSFDVGFGGPWDSGVMNEIPVDSEGYPFEIPYNTSRGPTMVRGVISAQGSIPEGDYVLLYDGSGTIGLYGNSTITNNTPGRIEFSLFGNGNQWFHIEQSASGDHIHNIRIVRKIHEANFETDPFYETFLERINVFSTIRFMDWGHTNGSELISWSDRVSPTYHTQGSDDGVSYEKMIELVNRLEKDIWVCVPHQADDNFITQMATLFKNNLNSNSTIYVEYSNEVWNWQFAQAHWVNDNGPDHLVHPRKYAERCRRVFDIWHSVFAGDTTRVKRVLATQAVNPWLAQQAMAQLKDNFDYLSPTWYFGYNGTFCEPTLDSLGANATAQDVLDCTIQAWRSAIPAFRQIYDDARLYGKEVIEYEGGQHMTSNPVTETFQQAVYDAQIHPNIKLLYQEVIDSLRRWDSKLAMAFTLASPRESIYGSWGALEDIDQDTSVTPSPKWEVINENIQCYNPKPVTIELSPKVFLEGAYDLTSGLMKDALRQGTLIPTAEPYHSLGFTCQISDTTAASVFAVTGNNAIVDWIFVELRDKTDSTKILHTRSALLQRDGDIVDSDGISPIRFYAKADDYFIALRHRNHLGIMSLNTFSLSENTASVNFSTIPTFGTDAQKDLGNGIFGMWSADLNLSGAIDGTDRSFLWADKNLLNYRLSDVNLDGKTDAADRILGWNNRNKTARLP